MLKLFQYDSFEDLEDCRKYTDRSDVTGNRELCVILAEGKDFGFFAVVRDLGLLKPVVEAALTLVQDGFLDLGVFEYVYGKLV